MHLELANSNSNFTIRSGQDIDTAFVINSYLESFRDAPASWGIRNMIYYDIFTKIIKQLLASSSLLCAVDKDDDKVILAYVLFSDNVSHVVIHYLYTKFAFRRFGLATHLVELISHVKQHNSQIACSHYTNNQSFKNLINKYDIIYDPRTLG